jgi:hypothetical protein
VLVDVFLVASLDNDLEILHSHVWLPLPEYSARYIGGEMEHDP